MVTRNQNNLVRVTVTLRPSFVDLLDELARFEGTNRSAELRGLLDQVEPVIGQIVGTLREVERQREALDQAMVNATVSELEAITPELEQISRRFMGAMAKLEGHAAATGEAPGSNTGATN